MTPKQDKVPPSQEPEHPITPRVHKRRPQKPEHPIAEHLDQVMTYTHIENIKLSVYVFDNPNAEDRKEAEALRDASDVLWRAVKAYKAAHKAAVAAQANFSPREP